MGGFRDCLPVPRICKSFFKSAIGFSLAQDCFDAFFGSQRPFSPGCEDTSSVLVVFFMRLLCLFLHPDNTVANLSRPILSRMDETPKAISPFGGLASFISFLGQIGFARQVQAHLPFSEPTSNNAIPQPGTLRVAVFLCGAVLGVMGRDVVVRLSAAWGGLRKHKPLVRATLNWLKSTSPKLIPPEDRLAIGGGMI